MKTVNLKIRQSPNAGHAFLLDFPDDNVSRANQHGFSNVLRKVVRPLDVIFEVAVIANLPGIPSWART